MKKQVIPRELARRDVDRALDNYLDIADPRVALNLIDGLERAYAYIASHPAAGSPRFSFELGIPNLRHVRIKGFPYLIFYLDLATNVDVWRVLHAQSDLPVGLDDPDTMVNYGDSCKFRRQFTNVNSARLVPQKNAGL